MNLLLIEREELSPEGRFKLRDGRVTHIRKVLRLGPGGVLRAGIISGGIGNAEIESIGERSIDLRFTESTEGTLPQSLELIVALPRPQIFKKILEFAASVAVSKLTFIKAERVEPSFFQAKILDPAIIRRHLLLGMEQGMSTYFPSVELRSDLSVLRNFSAVAERLDTLYVCHPDGDTPSNFSSPRNGHSPIRLAIGPEGGWTEPEIRVFRAAECRFLSLSPFVLRTDNAVVYAVAAANL